MQEGSREVLQRLLYFSHREHFDSFLKYFDEKERALLAAIPKIDFPINLTIDDSESTLARIHYSWFIEICEKCPKSFLTQILTAFDEKQASKLKKVLKIKNVAKTSSPFMQKFLVHWLLKELGIEHLLPTCFYSHVNSFFILKIGKPNLVNVIHKLGIIDLANMAKKIVDKKTLKELQKFFSAEQKKLFLEAQKTYSDPLPTSLKDLAKNLEDDRSFTRLIEKRGLLRLAIALANENSFLVWHIAHVLDIGRGKELLSLVRRCVPTQHTPYYFKQLLTLCEPHKKET